MDSVTWQDRDGKRWIQLEGELDHQACTEIDLQAKLEQALEEGEWDVVVVLEGVTFICSMAIGMLVATGQDLKKQGRQLQLSGLPHKIRELFGTMRLLDQLEEI